MRVLLITLGIALSMLASVYFGTIVLAKWTLVTETSNGSFSNANGKHASIDNKEIEQIKEHLHFLWEQYVRMIELMITLLTGVIAVAGGLAHFGSKEKIAKQDCYIYSMVALIVALVAAVIWRVGAQIFMEQEIFGDATKMGNYFFSQHIPVPFTTSYLYDQSIFQKYIKTIVMISQAFVVFGFSGGLIGLAIFTHSNLSREKKEA
jgi:hypothetical protein